MRVRGFAILAISFLCGFRCSLPWEDRAREDVSIVSYNAHNLFDDVDDGDEYPEFSVRGGTWNSSLYQKRLGNTASALLSFFPGSDRAPDIICLEEIEGEKVLRDLARGPLKRGNYKWMALSGPEESAVQCGLLSRLPIAAVRTHGLGDAWGFGPSRNVLEATVKLGAEPDAARLALFVCHWKSRREGAEATEAARRAASGLVAARLGELAAAEPETCAVVCGDFNESPDEFAATRGAYATAFMPDPRAWTADSPGKKQAPPESWFDGVIRASADRRAARIDGSGVTLYSPWADSGGFSYVYDGEGQRLDGFLLGPGLLDGAGLEFSRFTPSGDEALLDDKGEPFAWNGSSGYSDHLPIALILSRGEEP